MHRDGKSTCPCHRWDSVSEWLPLWTTLGLGTLLKGTSPATLAAPLLPGHFSFGCFIRTWNRKDLWLKYESRWCFYCSELETPLSSTHFDLKKWSSTITVKSPKSADRELNSSIVHEAGHLSPKGSRDGLQPLHDPINNSRSIKQKMMNGGMHVSSRLLKWISVQRRIQGVRLLLQWSDKISFLLAFTSCKVLIPWEDGMRSIKPQAEAANISNS